MKKDIILQIMDMIMIIQYYIKVNENFRNEVE